MTQVGNKFPNIEVTAINELGDSFKINVFKKAKTDNKKILLFVLLDLLSVLNCQFCQSLFFQFFQLLFFLNIY